MKNYLRYLVLGAHILGVIVIFFFSYVGFIYIFKDNLLLAQILCLFIAILLVLLVFWISSVKEKEENTGFTLREGIGLTIYAGLALGAFVAMSHAINIEYLLKENIRKAGEDKLEELRSMTENYEKRVDEVNALLATEIDNHILEYRTRGRSYDLRGALMDFAIVLNDPSDAERRKDAILRANRTEALKSIQSMKNGNETFIKNTEQVFADWERAKLHSIFGKIDDKLAENLSKLQADFMAPDNNKKWNEYQFEFALSERKEDIFSDPFMLRKENAENYNTGIPILVALAANLFALLPYLATGRRGMRRIYISPKLIRDDSGRIKI